MSMKRKRSFSEIVDEYFKELEEWAAAVVPLAARPSWNLQNCSIEPLQETLITPTEVLITVDLPFTAKNAVKVKPVGKKTIEISAKMNRTIKLDDLGLTHCRGEFQKYHCHTRIPVPVSMTKMKVHYKKRLLEIHLPRKHG